MSNDSASIKVRGKLESIRAAAQQAMDNLDSQSSDLARVDPLALRFIRQQLEAVEGMQRSLRIGDRFLSLERQEALIEVIKIVGTGKDVARALGVSRQMVSMWKRFGWHPKWTIELERLTGGRVSRYRLDPEHYPATN